MYKVEKDGMTNEVESKVQLEAFINSGWIISGRSQPKRRKQQWKRERRAKKTIFRADLGRISAKSFAVWLSV